MSRMDLWRQELKPRWSIRGIREVDLRAEVTKAVTACRNIFLDISMIGPEVPPILSAGRHAESDLLRFLLSHHIR